MKTLICLFLLTFSLFLNAQSLKMGVLDSAVLMNELILSKQVQAAVDSMTLKIKKNIKESIREFEIFYEKASKWGSCGTKDNLNKLKLQLKNKQDSLKNKIEELEQLPQNYEKTLHNWIWKLSLSEIKNYAIANNYQYILTKEPAFIWASPELVNDITFNIAAQINSANWQNKWAIFLTKTNWQYALKFEEKSS